MNASVYQGESRAPLRWTIVGLLLVISVILAKLLFEKPGIHSPRDPPLILQLPYRFLPLGIALGGLAVYGLVQFGRRRSPLRWGTIALLSIAYLKESQWALSGYEIRNMYICGAVFGGWLFGLLFSRALDSRIGRPGDVLRDDAFGEAGAAGVFAAVYLGAFVSKLVEAGLSWGDGPHLLAVVLSRRMIMRESGTIDGYLEYVVAHPAIATTMAFATIAIQGAMVLYLVSPRWRMVLGALIIAFHLNGLVFMGVRYVEPMVLSLVMSYPWPRIWRRLRGRAPVAVGAERLVEEADLPAVTWVTKRALRWMGTIGAVSLAGWFALHWRDGRHLLRERGFGDDNQHGSGRMNEPAASPPGR